MITLAGTDGRIRCSTTTGHPVDRTGDEALEFGVRQGRHRCIRTEQVGTPGHATRFGTIEIGERRS